MTDTAVKKVRETTLDFPTTFRNSLVKKRSLSWSVIFVVTAVIIGSHFLMTPSRSIIGLLPSLIPLPLGFLLWRIELNSPWKYVLAENDYLQKYTVTGIGFSLWQTLWNWRTISLSAESGIEITEAKCCGLPAYCLKKRAKYAWQEYSLYIVFTNADEIRFKMEFLPLIEKYRQQTPLWADRLS